MTAARIPITAPPILPGKPAAAAVAMSVDSSDRVRSAPTCGASAEARSGSYPTADLERWAIENAEHLLGDPSC